MCMVLVNVNYSPWSTAVVCVCWDHNISLWLGQVYHCIHYLHRIVTSPLIGLHKPLVTWITAFHLKIHRFIGYICGWPSKIQWQIQHQRYRPGFNHGSRPKVLLWVPTWKRKRNIYINTYLFIFSMSLPRSHGETEFTYLCIYQSWECFRTPGIDCVPYNNNLYL